MKMSAVAEVATQRNRVPKSDLFLRLNKLRHEGLLCDLTIVVQSQKFKAHKVVMAACSDYFLAAICGGKGDASVSVGHNSDQGHMTVTLQYATIRGFAPLLDYAYTSELNVNACDVIDVLSAASYMQMFDVANACSNFMRTSMLNSNQTRLESLQFLANQSPVLRSGRFGHNTKLNTSAKNTECSPFLPDPLTSMLQAASNKTESSGAKPPTALPSKPSVNQTDGKPHQWTGSKNIKNSPGLVSQLVDSPAEKCEIPAPLPRFFDPTKSRRSDEHFRLNPDPQHDDQRVAESTVDGKSGSPQLKEKNALSPLGQLEIQKRKRKLSSNSNSSSNNNYSGDERVRRDYNETMEGVAEVKRPDAFHDEPGDEKLFRKQRGIQDLTVTSNQENVAGGPGDSWHNFQRLYGLQRPELNAAWNPARLLAAGGGAKNAELLQNTLGSVVPAQLNTAVAAANVLDHRVGILPQMDSRLAMLSKLNGFSLHRQFIQRQMLAHQQQQAHLQSELSKRHESDKSTPDLPAVPPSGQYMSVRRRTLQSDVPKPHQCQICGSRFTRYHNLKQHIKLHSGVKPYECDVCCKRFTRNYTLRLHKMKHIGLRNFRCATCSAAFTSLGEFRAHLRLTMHSHVPRSENDGFSHARSDMQHKALSNAPMAAGPAKFGRFENPLLGFGIGSPGSSGGGAAGEGSVGTISPPTNEARNVLSGMESPLSSGRSCSTSPEDLSSKRLSADEMGTDERRDAATCDRLQSSHVTSPPRENMGDAAVIMI